MIIALRNENAPIMQTVSLVTAQLGGIEKKLVLYQKM